MSVESHPWTYIHPLCGKPAMHRVALPFSSDPIWGLDHEHIDGRPCELWEIFACDSCGGHLYLDLGAVLLNPDNWRKRVAV